MIPGGRRGVLLLHVDGEIVLGRGIIFSGTVLG